MLVLSRKNREAVVIGGSDGLHRLLKVTVLGIHGTDVTLGFEVNADVPVQRSEVLERIQARRRIDCRTRDSAIPSSHVHFCVPLDNQIETCRLRSKAGLLWRQAHRTVCFQGQVWKRN
jgi:carbon storage regulator CsrA